MKIYRSEKMKRIILSTYDELLSAWGVAIEEKDITTRYGGTHVICCGKPDGQPLVLFHGVGDDSAVMWLANAADLAGHFFVFAVDTIGGPGKSRPGTGYDRSFDDGVWIDELLAGLGLDKCLMTGVSHGAYLVQYYAATRPDKVRRLVCLAGSVPLGQRSPMATMIKIFFPEALFPTRKNVEKLIRKMAGENASRLLDDELFMKHYTALIRGFNNLSMTFHKLVPLTDEQLDGLRGRALYLVGDRDPFARMGGKEALLRHQMNARFFPDAGHAINYEIAENINPIIIRFLSDAGSISSSDQRSH